jgi:hypothetical protein
MPIETRQKGRSTQDPSERIMTSWMFDIKFPYDTRFTFGSLTFAAGEDGNLKMLPCGPALERLAPVYGQTPYFLPISSTTGGAYSCLHPYAGIHICTIKLVRGIPIVTSILLSSTRASSSSSSTALVFYRWPIILSIATLTF